MLAMIDAATSVQATAEKPCPESLGLIAYGSLTNLLNITRPTLDKKARDPKENFPKRVMLGKRYYIRRSDLKRWLDEKYGG
jgi:predicted DNA-binding transcriptional regulator AlpA